MQTIVQLDVKEETTVPCQKCGTSMVLAAITPHPIAAQMQRHTYLCITCNQTKAYMLPGRLS
jgi:DNA-directed RNA polymerase subunit RPC12/RpoP